MVGVDHRRERLRRVDRADRHARLDPCRQRDLGSVIGECALNGVEMFENRPIVEADPHAALGRQPRVTEQRFMQLGLDFQRDFGGLGGRGDDDINRIAPAVAAQHVIGMTIEDGRDATHHAIEEVGQRIFLEA